MNKKRSVKFAQELEESAAEEGDAVEVGAVVCLIDTPGAFPGLEAEERGQGEAIARNIFEMTRLKVPIIVVIIGEGASGGALGIGVGDRVFMLENTWYSVISPESCSSILWRSWDYKERAAEALKLTAPDMNKLKLIDGIIKEPLGGAHSDREMTYKTVRDEIMKSFAELKKLSSKKLVETRMEKYLKMGVYILNTILMQLLCLVGWRHALVIMDAGSSPDSLSGYPLC